MSPFKNIILWGVGCERIGYQIINALTKDRSYNVTFIARQGSKSTHLPQITVKRVPNGLSHLSLVEALKDWDVAMSAVGSTGILGQVKAAKAAVEAGVKLLGTVPLGALANFRQPRLSALALWMLFIRQTSKENITFT
ncbi:hypothetical protein BGZ60DRAFT_429903 [Tricladium varicosporioides]|nr:hypothetical protein BGZ60DRAFT_429903 [Hymenoscyphus varicosporioides]